MRRQADCVLPASKGHLRGGQWVLHVTDRYTNLTCNVRLKQQPSVVHGRGLIGTA